MIHKSRYFYGNKISDYGIENGYVDYRTLAKSFDAVLNNNIMEATDRAGIGYWEQISGFVDNSEEIDELQERIDELTEQYNDAEDEATEKEIESKIDELQQKIDELQDDQDYPPEVYQWYIVSDNAVSILEEAGEIVYYNEELDINLWGVTHWGTSWDYVLTNIKLELDENDD